MTIINNEYNNIYIYTVNSQICQYCKFGCVSNHIYLFNFNISDTFLTIFQLTMCIINKYIYIYIY